jgi:hypothetical protein
MDRKQTHASVQECHLDPALRASKGQGDRTIDEWKADQLAGLFGSGQRLEREIDGYEHDREREDEDELDRDIMDRDEAIAVDEAASSVTCAICGKEIPHGLKPECDEGGKIFCDGCAKI